MSKPLLIIISGLPCTGKTILSKKISKVYNLPLVSKDEIKELLFDSLGVKDREWSRQLGVATFSVMYNFVEKLLLGGTSFILESPINPKFDEEKFLKFQEEYDFHAVQIVCSTDPDVLFKRFQIRTESGERHPGHVDHQNYNAFKEILTQGPQQPLNIRGEIIEVDTTDFENTCYESILSQIESFRNL